MADLKQITQQVIDKEKKSLDSKVEEAKQAADEEIQAAKEQAAQDKERQLERLDQEASNQYDIEVNSIAIKERNEKLKIKQDYIKQVLANVQEKLDDLGQEDFQKFVQGVLSDFSQEGDVALYLGDKSQGLVDQAWLSNLDIQGLNVTLAETTIKGESGFTLSKKGIEFNYLFSELIANRRDDFVRQINQELFS